MYVFVNNLNVTAKKSLRKMIFLVVFVSCFLLWIRHCFSHQHRLPCGGCWWLNVLFMSFAGNLICCLLFVCIVLLFVCVCCLIVLFFDVLLCPFVLRDWVVSFGFVNMEGFSYISPKGLLFFF
jgi:hypothetical protein